MNKKYYIIQFSYKKIIINDLIEDELYSELRKEPDDCNFSGFVFNKDNNDYLCVSSFNGYINIWDLYNKQIFGTINSHNCKFTNIIQWNNKYIIVVDHQNKSLKIFDSEEKKIISNISGEHNKDALSIKKINHPVYGESLLTGGKKGSIKLWIIN
jgi:WD40 repeat protein